MEIRRPPLALRALRGLGRAVDVARRVTVNLIFLALVALAIALAGRPRPARAGEGRAGPRPRGHHRRAARGRPGPARGRRADRPVGAPDRPAATCWSRSGRPRTIPASPPLSRLSDLDRAGMTKLADLGAAIDDFRASTRR